MTDDVYECVRAALTSDLSSSKLASARSNTIAVSARSSEDETASSDAYTDCSNDPIGFDISPNFSFAKQLYFEKHEGLKVIISPLLHHPCTLSGFFRSARTSAVVSTASFVTI